VTHLLLDSDDVDPPFAQRRLTVLSTARCGERTDWLWVAVEPPLEYGTRGWLPGMPGLPAMHAADVLAIAPRHPGASLEAGPWPVDVYVCRARADETRLAAEFSPDDVSADAPSAAKRR
jgi:hypothetical protein